MHTWTVRWLAVAAGSLLAAGCGPQEPPAAPAARTAAHAQVPGQLQVQQASLGMLDIQPVSAKQEFHTVWAPARIAFRDDRVMAVGAPVEARIVEVHAHVGDAVKAGAPLATLASPEGLKVRHEQAAARAALAVAQAEDRRQQTMLDKGVGTEVDRAAARARLVEAAQEADRASRTAALLGGGANDRIVLRAPRAGVVAARTATPGAAVSPSGDPLFMVGDPGAVWVVAEVFESDLAGVREGVEAQVEFSSLSQRLAGRVQRVGAVLSEDTRRAQVFVSLQGGVPSVRPGMLARVGLQVPASEGMVIPLTAVLIKDERRSIVYVQRGETSFEARDVTLGMPARGFIPVLGGLEPGDRIVVRGALLLDGAAAQLL